MQTLSVGDGEKIDYSAVDVSSLSKHLDIYTEQAFSSWDITPETTDKDITVKALSKTAVISCDAVPQKKRYFTRIGRIDTKGLKVTITINTQTPVKDSNNNYIVETNVIDISKSCKTSPANLMEAFTSSDKAVINVMPVGQDKTICSFEIECLDYLGDVNNNKKTDSADASAVLTAYANMSVSADYTITDDFIKRADINMDNKVDAQDASYILSYYAYTSVDASVTWENMPPFAS